MKKLHLHEYFVIGWIGFSLSFFIAQCILKFNTDRFGDQVALLIYTITVSFIFVEKCIEIRRKEKILKLIKDGRLSSHTYAPKTKNQ